MFEPLKPTRGGFLRPFGCGWFIREFLMGHAPYGSPMGDPEVGDYDSDAVPDLMVKFDRSDVQSILEPGNEVEVTVSGELMDGTAFEVTDTIRVIDKGKK